MILKRLLMYGRSKGGSDIPSDAVYAFPCEDGDMSSAGPVGVGCASIFESNDEVYSQ